MPKNIKSLSLIRFTRGTPVEVLIGADWHPATYDQLWVPGRWFLHRVKLADGSLILSHNVREAINPLP